MRRILEHHCPRCQIPLATIEHQGTRPSMCGRCRGVFLREPDLKAQLGGSAELITNAEESFVPIQDRIECPDACALMEARVISHGLHAVTVDRCPVCRGLWLDGGELRSIFTLGRDGRQREAKGRAARKETDAIAKAKRKLADDHAFMTNADDDLVTKSSTGWWLVSFITQLPLEGFNPVYRTPLITWLLIMGCVGVFGWELQAAEEAAKAMSFIPALWLDPAEAYRMITAVFMHGGWLHLLGNMYFLKIFGDNVEDRLGHGWFIAFYLTAGILANVAYALTSTTPEIGLVGASGAIGGLLGAYLVFFPDARVSIAPQLLTLFRQFHVRAFFYLPFWLALQFFAASVGGGGVAWWAHIGGFISGFVLAWGAKLMIPDARVSYLAGRVRGGHAIG